MVYKLLLHLQFCNKFVKTLAFRGNGKKCLIYTETQWQIGRERILVSYWLAAFSLGFFISMQPMKTSGDTVGGWAQLVSTFLWTFPEMPPLLHKHCRQALQYSLCFSQNGLQYPLFTGQKVQTQPVGSFSPHIFFPFLFSFRYNFNIISFKNRKRKRKCKNHQWFSSYFCSFQPDTF
jgi:hypothetical protein